MQFSRRNFLKTSGMAASSLLMASQFRCMSKQKKPNVILLYSDEMDPSYIGFVGHQYPTPNLDQLAADGMHFTNAFACAAMCTPSRFGVLTGQYPGRCIHSKFLKDFPKDQPYSIGWNSYLTEENSTLPRLLSQNGYITGMAGKWHLGKESADETDILADVDPQIDLDAPGLNDKLKQHQQILQKLVTKQAGFDMARSVIWENNDGFHVKKVAEHNFPWVTKGTVDLIDTFQQQDKPFFIYVATTACHGPNHAETLGKDMRYTQEGRMDEVLKYCPDTEKIKSEMNNLSHFEQFKYAGMAELDHHVGEIVKKLKESNLENDTIVLFMADHNTEPGKASCFQKGLHVPFILKWPGKIGQNSESDVLTQNVDIMPTILDIAGIPVPQNTIIDGKSLLPVIENKSDKVRDYAFADAGYARSVSDGKFKYIAFRPPQTVIEAMKQNKNKYAPNYLNIFKQAHASITIQHFPNYFDQDQLYNLEEDPYEISNLAYDENYAEILKKMKNVLTEHLQTMNHPFYLERISYMETKDYKKKAAKTRALGTQHIVWWDESNVTWPPENE